MSFQLRRASNRAFIDSRSSSSSSSATWDVPAVAPMAGKESSTAAGALPSSPVMQMEKKGSNAINDVQDRSCSSLLIYTVNMLTEIKTVLSFGTSLNGLNECIQDGLMLLMLQT